MNRSVLAANWPLLAVAGALLVMGALYWAAPPFAIDSWAFYELSESLRSGHYQLGQLRSFRNVVPNAPATSFPPLWPLIWAGVSTITHFGARSGFALTILCTFLFAIVSESVGRTLTQIRWAGLCAALLTIRLPGYWEEVITARAIPMQLLLTSLALLIALRQPKLRVRDSAAIGLLAGALVMTRFDMLPVALILGGAVVLLSRSWIAVGAYGLAVAIVISPWVWMSQHYYGSWLASDNSGVALSIDPKSFVRDWFPPGSSPPTVFDQPVAWILKLLRNGVGLITGVVRSPGLVGVALIVGIFAAAVFGRRTHSTPRPTLRSTFNAIVHVRTRLTLALFSLAVIGMLPMYLLSGYFMPRYFSLLNWFIYLWFAVALMVMWQAKRSALQLQRAAGTASAALVGLLLLTKGAAPRVSDPSFPDMVQAPEVARCLSSDQFRDSSRLLVMDGLAAARLSAVHHIATSFTPSNFERMRASDEMARQFFSEFHITHVLGTATEIDAMFSPQLFQGVDGNCGVPLLRVK